MDVKYLKNCDAWMALATGLEITETAAMITIHSIGGLGLMDVRHMDVGSSLHGNDTTSILGVHQVKEIETSICEAHGTSPYFIHSKILSICQAEHARLVKEAAGHVECTASQFLQTIYPISEAEGTNLTETDFNPDHMVTMV